MFEVGQNLHFFFFNVKVLPPRYESTTCSLQKTWKTVDYSISYVSHNLLSHLIF